MTFLLYGSPVIYPASMVPDKYINLYFLNPLAPIIEGFRFALFGIGTISISRLAYSFCFMLVVIIIGLILFNRTERNFMDTI